MKNKRKVGLIAISIAAFALIVLAFTGVFTQKIVPRLPEEAANHAVNSKLRIGQSLQ